MALSLLMRIGILTEFPSPAVLSGPAIHTQLLRRSLEKRGHSTLLMGPRMAHEPQRSALEVHAFSSVPWPTHPKVRVALPGPSLRHLWNAPSVELIHAQTNTFMSDYANWMRRMWQVPVINTHTIHIPSHSHFILSDTLYASEQMRRRCEHAARDAEKRFAQLYNGADCLIVQSRHFVDYWRERGVIVPIEVVGRPVDPERFDAPMRADPFPTHFKRGQRLLVVCRHDREKGLDHLIRLCAERIFPQAPEASLTLVGDGHAHEHLKAQAMDTPFRARFHFAGEVAHERTVDWYRHADLFTYTSLSETFGNVVNEALWCALPVVAMDDEMGVSHQVRPNINGLLIRPGQSRSDADFAEACLTLLRAPSRRRRLGLSAANMARESAHPDTIMSRYEAIYEDAKGHCKSDVLRPLSEAPRRAQVKAFAFHMGRWAWGHSTLLSLAYAGLTLGISKPRRSAGS